MSKNTPIVKGSTKRHPFLSSVEELIEEARNGRIFILVDDEDRENEGDLIIPAQMATPAAINFMATHGRGLVCLAMTKERVTSLGLAPMSRENNAPLQTAFTVSIEAKEGVTTGISAGDRARTIAVAIDSSRGAEDIVTPGHVFPLAAKSGGVLVRAGHTEAAVDIARLAGLNASGVICEVMKEDGTMARLDDLVTFAQRHNIKIGTIRDLIAWRREHDNNVELIEEKSFNSLYAVIGKPSVSETKRPAANPWPWSKDRFQLMNRPLFGCTPLILLRICWVKQALGSSFYPVRWKSLQRKGLVSLFLFNVHRKIVPIKALYGLPAEIRKRFTAIMV